MFELRVVDTSIAFTCDAVTSSLLLYKTNQQLNKVEQSTHHRGDAVFAAIVESIVISLYYAW